MIIFATQILTNLFNSIHSLLEEKLKLRLKRYHEEKL